MSHSLIVGGTGMLAGVAVGLARQKHTVTVVARDSDGLISLGERVQAVGGKFNAVHHDYRDAAQMIEKLDTTTAIHGPYDNAISNIHDTPAPQATGQLAEFLDTIQHTCQYWDILGSSAADPSLSEERRSFRSRRFASRLDHVIYHEIILGWKMADHGPRWLTHDEIAHGVLKAMANGAQSTFVGTVTPWSDRPDH
ncbi:hypothetical protein GF356_05070 [candidate division GN15 bacterium]|nr:hypothetical protein [candidate division GN15 bacterium]